MNEELMLKAREEYSVLPVEEQTKYLAQLAETYGQDFVDAFTSFMETGNFPKFAAQVTTTPEFPAGELKEIPGMANGYERTMEEVAASLNAEHAPVYEAIVSMGNELNAATPVKQAEMMDQLASARGQEFSEAVYYTFKHPDFCEYIAREAQTFFDTLARNFSQSKDQVSSLIKIGNFSETLSKGVLSYATKGKPGNFSILESVALLSTLARKDFSENGELAEAIMELGEGDVSPEGAETLAENIEQYADGDTADVPEQIQEIAAQADDVPPTQQAEEKDMSEGRRKAKIAALTGAGLATAGAGYAGAKFIPGMIDRAKASIANSYWGNKAAGAVAANQNALKMAGNNVDLALAKEAGSINALNQKALLQGQNLGTNWAQKGAEAVNQRMNDAANYVATNKLANQKIAENVDKALAGRASDIAALDAQAQAEAQRLANPKVFDPAIRNTDWTSSPTVLDKIKNSANGAVEWAQANPVKAAAIGVGTAALAGAGAYGLKKLHDRKKAAKAMKAAGFSEQDIATSQPDVVPAEQAPADAQQAPVDDQTVMREKEQNNAMLDAIVEKYKALQTEEAKAQMVQEMQQLLDPELVQYIISRAEGEDFSEGEQPVDQVAQAPAEGQEVTPVSAPTMDAESGDVDKYEELSKQLLGQYEEDPVGKVVASEAPVAVATLPEGAPVATTEGGATMAEDYEREPIIDKYEEMGLI